MSCVTPGTTFGIIFAAVRRVHLYCAHRGPRADVGGGREDESRVDSKYH